MPADQHWLDSLPELDQPEDDLAISGIAVGAPAGRLRLLVTAACVDFDTRDVILISGLDPQPGARATPVDVVVRKGAPVLAVQDADALFVGDAFGQATFPYFTRTRSRTDSVPSAYRKREQDYLRRWNLAGDA